MMFDNHSKTTTITHMDITTTTIIKEFVRFGINMFTAIVTISPMDDGRVDITLDMTGGTDIRPDDFTPAENGDVIVYALARHGIIDEKWNDHAVRFRAFDNADGFPRLGGRIIDGDLFLV